MKILIIEDEPRAANRLSKQIKEVAPEMEVVAVLESIRDAVTYLKENNSLALIFSDIQLADGLSFEIFEQVAVTCPIIFTTAYDQYAIKAFKTNGIDYLLKPISEEDLQKAIDKFKRMAPAPAVSMNDIMAIANSFAEKKDIYKSRFMIKIGEKIKSIATDDVLYFFSREKATYLMTNGGKKYLIDYSVEQLEDLTDSQQYFRINRKFLIAINAIDDIVSFSNSRLKTKLNHSDDDDVIVSRERVQEFKRWLDR